MAGSAVSCRPHPRQEPSALARTLGSVRRGALGNQRSYRDESAIHNQECHSLDRVRARARDGFARTVALAIFVANLHQIGLALQRAKRDNIRNHRRRGIRRAA